MLVENPNTRTLDLLEIERNARAMQARYVADTVSALGRMIVSVLRRKPSATAA